MLLGERFEKMLLEFLAHADAGVADRDLHEQPIIRRHMAAQFIGDRPILWRVFHRIREEVEINLVGP